MASLPCGLTNFSKSDGDSCSITHVPSCFHRLGPINKSFFAGCITSRGRKQRDGRLCVSPLRRTSSPCLFQFVQMYSHNNNKILQIPEPCRILLLYYLFKVPCVMEAWEHASLLFFFKGLFRRPAFRAFGRSASSLFFFAAL